MAKQFAVTPAMTVSTPILMLFGSDDSIFLSQLMSEPEVANLTRATVELIATASFLVSFACCPWINIRPNILRTNVVFDVRKAILLFVLFFLAFVWIVSQSGGIAEHFSRLAYGRNRLLSDSKELGIVFFY